MGLVGTLLINDYVWIRVTMIKVIPQFFAGIKCDSKSLHFVAVNISPRGDYLGENTCTRDFRLTRASDLKQK